MAREVKNEIGLEVKILEQLGTYEIEINDLPYHFVVYEAKIVSGTDIVLSSEHTEYKWADKQELLKLNLNTFLKEFIREK